MPAYVHRRSRRFRLSVLGLLLVATFAAGCSGLFQNLGAKWVTRQIADEFKLDEAQTEATRASVERLIAAAPAALDSKVDMIVATVDTGIAKGFAEQGLIRVEKQVEKLVDVVAGAIIDEASPILATLTDEQIDYAEGRINERLDEARERLAEPPEERLEGRQDRFVESVEDWAGEITPAQDASLRAHMAKQPDELEARVRADEMRLGRIAALLRKHPGPEAIRDGLWLEWKSREDLGEGARPATERRAEGRQTILYVYGLMTPEQKANASKHLHELHDQLKSFLGAAGT